MLFGEQPPRVVHARPGDVRVDVHAPGHHDHAAGVEPRSARRQLGDDAVALDAHIAHDAVRPPPPPPPPPPRPGPAPVPRRPAAPRARPAAGPTSPAPAPAARGRPPPEHRARGKSTP